ncbi:unnamed protein product [Schistosoma rodhaini]|uniref:Uncharacterized protein n=1 Tax=Schistosoma rodhaini TaxID=6188 RepID=A0AA85FYH5_9TREM|nr:unnamed protein product [Schistosoma rodhaini]
MPTKKVTPKSEFKYYGQKVKELSISNSGAIEIHGDDLIGQISIFQNITFEDTFEVNDHDKFIAIKRKVLKSVYPEGK